MSNPKCALCGKTVYVTEKLDCLNKVWHKGCFRCTTCNQVLNLKTYQSIGGKPYCRVHSLFLIIELGFDFVLFLWGLRDQTFSRRTTRTPPILAYRPLLMSRP
jgi:hypothetical protein